MTYTVKPSEIYTNPTAQEEIRKLLRTWRITAFSFPKEGEFYIVADYSFVKITEYPTTLVLPNGPRFIVEPIEVPSLLEQWWE